MNNATPVVTASTASERCTVTCPWCGTVSTIRFLGVHALPSCGHVVHMQWRAPSRHGTPLLKRNTHARPVGRGRGWVSRHTPGQSFRLG
jgi:hypothetical protein